MEQNKIPWQEIDENNRPKEVFISPSGTITEDPVLAAEEWVKMFWKAFDALDRIRPVPERILTGIPVRDLQETLAECDSVLDVGRNLQKY